MLDEHPMFPVSDIDLRLQALNEPLTTKRWRRSTSMIRLLQIHLTTTETCTTSGSVLRQHQQAYPYIIGIAGRWPREEHYSGIAKLLSMTPGEPK